MIRASLAVAAFALSVASPAFGIGSAYATDDLVVVVELVAKTARPAEELDGIATAFDRLFVDLPGVTGLHTRISNNATAAWIVFDGSDDPGATLRLVRVRLDTADPKLLAGSAPALVRWQRGTLVDGSGPVQPVVELVATVDLPRTAPEAVERGVTRPILIRLATLPGVAHIRANSWESRSQTYIVLDPTFEVSGNERVVRDALEEVRSALPTGASPPTIVRTRSLDH